VQRKIWNVPETLAKAAVISNAHIRTDVLSGNCKRALGPWAGKKVRRLTFRAGRIGDNLAGIAWLYWETAMSEPKQQMIALWILLMLLLMVPWILE